MIAPTNDLRTLVVQMLQADAAVGDLVGDRIYDRVPAKPVFPYVVMGVSDGVEDDSDCITAETVTLQIDVWSQYQGGYRETEDINAAVKKVLHEPTDAVLQQHGLVFMRVPTKRAFRDRDGMRTHGVVTLEAQIEEK